jgi:hypothetical protein
LGRTKSAGRWFLTRLRGLTPSRDGDARFPQQADALWDTDLLFGRDGKWNQTPDGLVSWGYTIMRTREKLANDFSFATVD